MSGKSTVICDLLLRQDELIAFQHADGEIRRGVNKVVYFMGADFNVIMHDLLEKSGVVFETKFPTPDDLDALTEDGNRMVVLDDWMNRILVQDPKRRHPQDPYDTKAAERLEELDDLFSVKTVDQLADPQQVENRRRIIHLKDKVLKHGLEARDETALESPPTQEKKDNNHKVGLGERRRRASEKSRKRNCTLPLM